MKIHYKAILLDEKMQEFFGEYQHFVLRDKKRNLLIDYCCDEMKEAITQGILYVQEIGSKPEPDFRSDFKNDVAIYLQHGSFDSYQEHWYYHPLKVCPFCAEIITIVEDYKAVTKTRKKTIRQKTIKASTVTESYEEKIQ